MYLARGYSLLVSGIFVALLPFFSARAEDVLCTRPLTLALHEHGLLYSADVDQGIDKDIADALARRSGCKIILSLLPRDRIWKLIESGALDFSLSGITNADRDRYADFAWYFADKYSLLVSNGAKSANVAEFAADRGLKLGLIRSFRYGPYANAFVDKLDEQQRVVYANSLGPLYALLMSGRIHAMIVEPFDIPILESANIAARTKAVEFDDPAIAHGLIMSKAALAADERQRWRAVVDDLVMDGTIEKIFRKYFSAELSHQLTHF